MTRYWYDSEFIDDGSSIDLISVGIVCEDGRELYVQSVDFDASKANLWIHNNVLIHLTPCPTLVGNFPLMTDRDIHRAYGRCLKMPTCPWGTRRGIGREVERFLDPKKYGKPELWGWCSAYDYVTLCQIYGTMMDIPEQWPHHINDLQQILDERGISDDELPPQEEGLHNALSDARHLKKLWGYIVRNDCWQ